VTGLVQADAVELPVADDTVDLVITSPPYFALRSYQDDGEHYDGQIGSEATPAEFLDALWAVTAECVRVLKPSGSLWVNLGDKYSSSNSGQSRLDARTDAAKVRSGSVAGFRPKSLLGLPWRYAIGCIDDLGLILRAEVVWSKPNGLPESIKDRVRRSHEQWFHFTLEPRYFSAIDEIREPYSPETLADYESRARAGTGWSLAPERQIHNSIDNNRAANSLGKLPGSVWSIPSEPLQVPDELGVDHFAAFPQEWPRRLILGWCPAEVCTACGQGRAPVVDKTYNGQPVPIPGGTSIAGRHNSTSAIKDHDHLLAVQVQITGYACACPDTTAPSTPGVVLDPFAGTGTVPMVARALGRTGIGVDLSADYLRLARWRVFESGHASKTVARTNGERQGLLL